MLLAAVAVPAAVAERACARAGGGEAVAPAAPVAMTTSVTWMVLGGASLRRQGRRLGAELLADDLATARQRLPTL
ncbi:hypothetical protein [Frankia sp. QA3]|uniref:hypothetical protein n=1 Tax=Frankia sp. QA3 TaxID=710111 RepID=UPI000307F5DA|nr:hypothetical protein [Frankia sp. QA3]